MKKSNFIEKASDKQTNPILNFRKKDLGVKSSIKNKKKTKSHKKVELQNTMITKSREAIDSTEITAIYENL